MQTANASIYIMLKRKSNEENIQPTQNNRTRHFAQKRNLLLFTIVYGTCLGVFLKLLFL
ncbi:MAG: hypothetical protein ABI861_00525 [Panacibacter sp.]